MINNLNKHFANNNERSSTSNYYTPSKPKNDRYSSNSNLNNRTTMTSMCTTPISKRHIDYNEIEEEIHSPIKKTRKRDCTPNSPERPEIDYNLNEGSINVNLNNNFINQHVNANITQAFRYSRITKSKLELDLDDVDEKDKSSSFILNIRKAYLLIKNIDNNASPLTLFNEVLRDAEMMNKITNILCYSFFDGFNERSERIMKYISSQCNFEIDSLNVFNFVDGVKYLAEYVFVMNPDYSNTNVEISQNSTEYIFTIYGQLTLSTEHNEIKYFETKFKICLNFNEIFNNNESPNLNQLVNIDYIYLKVF